MRLNQYLAQNTQLSRRSADQAITTGRVKINGVTASLGTKVSTNDQVKLDETLVEMGEEQYVVINKPKGYICSRAAQGKSPTVYDLLPKKYHHLKHVGRLDKDSCGLLLLTNDGKLAQQLSHPSRQKLKVYEVRLEKPLTLNEIKRLEDGVSLEDGMSKLKLKSVGSHMLVSMHEGRNRQIRRTFAALGHSVVFLQRLQFGSLKLGTLQPGAHQLITKEGIL